MRRPSTPIAALPAPESTLQGLAFEALGDAWAQAELLFNDAEAGAAVASVQAVVLALADIANELRAGRRRLDGAIEKTFGAPGPGALEDELNPNGEVYRSAGS